MTAAVPPIAPLVEMGLVHRVYNGGDELPTEKHSPHTQFLLLNPNPPVGSHVLLHITQQLTRI